jgi:hypothetical protein
MRHTVPCGAQPSELAEPAPGNRIEPGRALITAVLDQAVIERGAEDAASMRSEQLAHILTCAQLPHVQLQVVPTGIGMYPVRAERVARVRPGPVGPLTGPVVARRTAVVSGGLGRRRRP